MQIKHVEELVGITRKNIRFYEDQGLLRPRRADNGYREYHEEEITRLKQIKILNGYSTENIVWIHVWIFIWRSWNVRKRVWSRYRK